LMKNAKGIDIQLANVLGVSQATAIKRVFL
jgi:hypothetical protein